MSDFSVAACGVRTRFLRSGAIAVICWFAMAAAAFADEAEKLIQWLPSSSNAVAIVRVEEMLRSPRGVRENWAQISDENFMNGAGGIPSWNRLLVVGFLVRPSVPEEVWAAAIASVPAERTVKSIAAMNQRSVIDIGGLTGVQGRGNSYVLQLDSGLLAVWRPGIRQEAARWAQSIHARTSGLTSDYLKNAAKESGQIVMALDLDHAFDPASTRAQIQMDAQTGTSAAANEQLANLLLGIQGATLSVAVQEELTATLRLDFLQPVQQQGPAVKVFFQHVLQAIGAGVDEFDKSELTAVGNALFLKSKFSDDSLRRVMSLITMTHEMPDKMTTPAPSSGLEESRRYFQAIDGFVRDLERASRSSSSYAQTALWHEKYAKKINDLAIRNVDAALVEYGANVASQLRSLGRSLQGQQIQLDTHQQTLTYNSTFTPGWASVNVWGGVGVGESAVNVTSNLQEVRERQAAAILAGDAQRRQVWEALTAERARILTAMQVKFGDDFIKKSKR